jgi:serine/threonine protein kinase
MSQALPTGSKLKDRYRIERELGRGGIGVVYLARDERLHGMHVVIKFLLDASNQHAWLAKKFLQEAEALTRISHPAVVRVIDRDTADDGRPFFVMEYIDGQSLRQVMKPEGMELGYIARLIRQIGQGLAAAHRQGVFHRDLKPENIMLQKLGGGEEIVKLIDFGIAKVLDSQAASETEVAIFAGSKAYLAPEQALSKPISSATDIFAFAIIVYEMITGRLPFNTSAANHYLAVQELLKLQETGSLIKPKHVRPELPEAAELMLLNALKYETNARPQNAQIFADELARALTGDVKMDASGEATELLEPGETPTTATTAEIPDFAPSTVVIETPKTNQPAPPPIKKRDGKGLKVGLGMAAAVIVGLLIWQLLDSSDSNTASQTPPPAASPTPASIDHELNFSITLRRNPRLYPKEGSYQVPGDMVFSSGDRVRFNFSSPEQGNLYLFNEGAAKRGGKASYIILFPSPTANQGLSQLSAGQEVIIPETGDGFIFDDREGEEKLWLVWSQKPLPNLEALKRWATPRDKGVIRDVGEVEALRGLLESNPASFTSVQKDEAAKLMVLQGRGELLVKLLKLEHR